MTNAMRVEIWSDVICPWCGIGQHRLDEALTRFPHREQVEVVHRSYQLDESAPRGRTVPVREALTKKYGLDDASFQAMTQRVEAIAAADGLRPYRVADGLTGNTSPAHELAAFARTKGLEAAAWSRLYRAHFGEGRSIFDVASLVDLAGELGLPQDEARKALETQRFAAQVAAEGLQARRMGVTGVPFVLVDGRYAVSGAQPVETFLRALEAGWAVHASNAEQAAAAKPGCDDGTCAAP